MSLAYNTLFKIKRQLGGIGLPPYTPLTPEAATVINPEYVAGMGAVKADPKLGLQCPICGEWLPSHLGAHAGNKHKDIGGATGLKKLLGYSPANALVTVDEHRREHDEGVRRYKAGGCRLPPPRRHGKAQSTYGHGRQNLQLSCRVQMVTHFQELTKKLGRQPSKRDWEREKLPWAFDKHSPMYQSWNALVVAAGSTPRKRGGQPGRPYQIKDFCKNGHSLNAERNIYRHPNGRWRRCRICMRRDAKEYRDRRAGRASEKASP